jgi:UDP-glucose 6-dehydrogenase
MYGNLNNKKMAIFGVTFKKNTNDIRESPALYVLDQLKYFDLNLRFYFFKELFALIYYKKGRF